MREILVVNVDFEIIKTDEIEVVIDDMLPRIVWIVGVAIEVGINNLSFIFKAENCTRVIIIGHVRF